MPDNVNLLDIIENGKSGRFEHHNVDESAIWK